MARPRKLPDESLSVWLNLRVTPAEADAAYQRAAREGRPLALLLREALRNVLRRCDTKTAKATVAPARALP